MRFLGIMSMIMILLSPLSSAEAEAVPQNEQAELQKISALHQEIVKLSQQIWAQLSAISNMEEADLAAESFSEYAQHLTKLDHELHVLEEQEGLSPRAHAAMEEMAPQIIECYVLLGGEFSSIYNSDCLQSQKLKEAFEQALRGGFFFLSHRAESPTTTTTLSSEQAEIELERIAQLRGPDEQAHACLQSVTDATTAKAAAERLLTPIAQLHDLRPENGLGQSPFQAGEQERYDDLKQPLERSLWGIRHEYVRIASSFAPESEDFSALANTLDELYLSLEETHTRIFSSIFDDSFLHDMDEAFAKHSEADKEQNFSTQP